MNNKPKTQFNNNINDIFDNQSESSPNFSVIRWLQEKT